MQQPQHTYGVSSPPRVIVSSDDPEFDAIILSHLKDEGFKAIYMPFDGNVKAYKNELAHLPDALELGESFAIIGTPSFHMCNTTTDYTQHTVMRHQYV